MSEIRRRTVRVWDLDWELEYEIGLADDRTMVEFVSIKLGESPNLLYFLDSLAYVTNEHPSGTWVLSMFTRIISSLENIHADEPFRH